MPPVVSLNYPKLVFDVPAVIVTKKPYLKSPFRESLLTLRAALAMTQLSLQTQLSKL